MNHDELLQKLAYYEAEREKRREASRLYQAKRYREDPVFRERRILRAREAYQKKRGGE